MKTKNSIATNSRPNPVAGHLSNVCLVGLLLLLLTLPAVVQAQDYSYTTNADNTITITGYTGDGGDVTVPDTIENLPVTSIGDWAFWFNTNLTNVTVGTNVTSIGYAAFYCCTSLTGVTIPNSVTNIGGETFWFNTSLGSVTIPNSVTSIGDSAFWSNTSLTNVDDWHQRHQHWRRCVRYLHQPEQHHDPRQRHQHRERSV